MPKSHFAPATSEFMPNILRRKVISTCPHFKVCDGIYIYKDLPKFINLHYIRPLPINFPHWAF